MLHAGRTVTVEAGDTTWRIYDGDEYWQRMQAPTGAAYAWDSDSTYDQNPPYFEGMSREPSPTWSKYGAWSVIVQSAS